MLAHHDAKESDLPHFCTAVPAGFQLVVDLLSFVGALHGRSSFVDVVPFLTVAGDRRKQTRVMLRVRVHATTVGRVRTGGVAGADALLH